MSICLGEHFAMGTYTEVSQRILQIYTFQLIDYVLIKLEKLKQNDNKRAFELSVLFEFKQKKNGRVWTIQFPSANCAYSSVFLKYEALVIIN